MVGCGCGADVENVNSDCLVRMDGWMDEVEGASWCGAGSVIICYTSHGALAGTRNSFMVMVDPLSYFSFQPVFHDWCNKSCSMC